MILLPEEDALPVGNQVNALIGEALRQSVAQAEPSQGFEARLAAALDAAERAAAAPTGTAGQGEEAVEAAS